MLHSQSRPLNCLARAARTGYRKRLDKAKICSSDIFTCLWRWFESVPYWLPILFPPEVGELVRGRPRTLCTSATLPWQRLHALLTAIACCMKLSNIKLHVRCMSAMLYMHRNARIALVRCRNLSRPRNRPARELAGPDVQARNATAF